ncbi:cytochrome b5-like heme/steroid binding domain-containing protein [Aspergillus bertholletiae]|uniref:Cytochrome b5-like heme/steroid binding domain-containing protein n=1 Tax=Aspergillus bertholletiae TaxID=1226010 RepID=A0A5N7BNT9_9EURO|nr:cytochrome b5-like heme/steroid binding domain-containing protein [Aspergillus bertholletiae]
MSQTLTRTEIAQHKTKTDLWFIVHDKVYDATKFLDEHPGGEDVLLDVAGQDASEAYDDVGHSDEAGEVLSTLQIGTVKQQSGDPTPKTMQSSTSETTHAALGPSAGIPSGAVYLGGLVGSLVAVGLYLNFATQFGA